MLGIVNTSKGADTVLIFVFLQKKGAVVTRAEEMMTTNR